MPGQLYPRIPAKCYVFRDSNMWWATSFATTFSDYVISQLRAHLCSPILYQKRSANSMFRSSLMLTDNFPFSNDPFFLSFLNLFVKTRQGKFFNSNLIDSKNGKSTLDKYFVIFSLSFFLCYIFIRVSYVYINYNERDTNRLSSNQRNKPLPRRKYHLSYYYYWNSLIPNAIHPIRRKHYVKQIDLLFPF